MPKNNGVTVFDFPAREPRRLIGSTKSYTKGPCSADDRGTRNRRILGSVVKGGYEYVLHATKGIRRYRLPAEGNSNINLIPVGRPSTVEPERLIHRVGRAAYLAGGRREKLRRLKQAYNANLPNTVIDPV